MNKRENCWEIKECGLGPGGSKTGEHGTCPACFTGLARENEGLNRGLGQGRACWTVEGTLCHVGARMEGASTRTTFKDCMNCVVFQRVQEEEGRFFELGLQKRLSCKEGE